ncbi:hypothetical protein HJC23_001807 [Cyclotella cryptica]|uniref:Uncharacterized protein n=1 Tax=Cyclotella cryptica TaxID=29204 RepID=A0ABD3PM24_9STRA|eukprot:CCRYP_014508-RA/>CCRYP_014508-RA protein AED:0.03 eAED:0.03 QI:321/1/1/1/1/1/3/2697/128
MLSPMDHLGPCLTNPIRTSVISGSIFTALDTLMSGRPLSFRVWGFYCGSLYAYNIVQCPMEVIHGRQSSLHNVVSGGLLGYIGVSRGMLSVPFVDPRFVYSVRHPGLVGALVYGGIGGALATIGGKPM